MKLQNLNVSTVGASSAFKKNYLVMPLSLDPGGPSIVYIAPGYEAVC